MIKPTEILSDEHKFIIKVIERLKSECINLERTKIIDVVFFQKAINFIRNYADKFHHAKEEDILFTELNKDTARMPCNPTEQMLYEHDLGRKYVKEMEQGVQNQQAHRIIENTRSYASLLEEHIYKEDNILYPMADEALDKQTQIEMLDKFDVVYKKFKDVNKISLFFLQKYGDK